MLIVLCSREDWAAKAFAHRFASYDVHTLTCQDLSREGWKLALRGHVGTKPEVELTAAIDRRRVGANQIEGVITRIGLVDERELKHIVAGDRTYVAAEMHAFLFAFLEALSCRIINPPSPACLYGPNVRPVQWRRYARELGIPVEKDHAGVTPGTQGCSSEVDITVVGGRIFGSASSRVLHWSRQLARISGASYLLVRYVVHGDDSWFVGADPYPRLESEEIGRVLIEYFSEKSQTC